MKPDAQSAMMDMVKELRSNPERYRKLKDEVAAAKTDAERIKVLTDFSLKAEGLRQAIPKRDDPEAGTTITVTTVIIVTPTAY